MKGGEKHNVPLPDVIIFQILEQLSVRSLLRFKCVSKNWCSTIDDTYFIESHRIRSRLRPNGITLLVCKSEKAKTGAEHKFSILDFQGKSLPLPYPKRKIDTNCLHDLQSVEGLVCLDNTIWNPSTRKTITLPPQIGQIKVVLFSGFIGSSILNRYVLGFDGSSKKHKVLSFSNISDDTATTDSSEIEWDLEKQVRQVTKVLTLGTNHWRDIELPEFLHNCHFRLEKSCCLNNMIYCLIDDEEYMLAFQLGQEEFRMIPFPDNVDVDNNDYVCHMFEVGGRLAIMNYRCTKLWMLEEDPERDKWSKVNVTWPETWELNSYGRFGGWTTLKPIGSIQTGEVLFKWEKKFPEESSKTNEYFCFLYDIGSKSIKHVPQLTGKLVKDVCCKHVDTLL